MDRIIRIGTRSSQLALWQAYTVADKLQALGQKTEIVKIDSIGDMVLDKPLYELGITGVFTKNLDIALLNGKIDISVNSFKDVPTRLPKGIVQAAVLERGDFNDILVYKNDIDALENESATIATGSLRRKAQWLHRYPSHNIVGLRGNVNTRLKKLEDNNWNGAIFAKAGLKRINLLPKNQKYITLDWMIPAPAQGAVMVATLEKDEELLSVLNQINHSETEMCVTIEREFLRILEGGCSAPIGALTVINNGTLDFKGVLFSPEGNTKLEYKATIPLENKKDIDELAELAAKDILNRGGRELMASLAKADEKPKVLITKNLTPSQLEVLSSEISVDSEDFITIKFNKIDSDLIKGKLENAIFTSKNAVKSLLESFDSSKLNFKSIFCVGEKTQSLIEKTLGEVTQMEYSATELANYLVEKTNIKEVTFFCGNKRRDELPDILKEENISVKEIHCYDTVLTSKKMPEAYSGIVFCSPSAVQSFIKENRPNNAVAFCIGDTTATEAKKHFKNIIVSKTTTLDSVLQAVNTYFR